ncbi:hypothetical protein [Streptomyces sp. NPDC047024]|uniref:hypothetical protein n=1 Tax=Streptomyces sp. NPDC047024 TaxID=3155476 RepID=UPI0033D944A9
MSRRLTARLARIEQAAPRPTDAPICRYHGAACSMGANWPLPFPEDQPSELLDMILEAQRAIGQEPEPHPRDVWATDEHDQKPAAELAAEKAELARLIAEAEAAVAAEEAAIKGGWA